MLQHDKGHFHYDFLGEKNHIIRIILLLTHIRLRKKKPINVKSLFTNENKSQILFWLGEHIYIYSFMCFHFVLSCQKASYYSVLGQIL